MPARSEWSRIAISFRTEQRWRCAENRAGEWDSGRTSLVCADIAFGATRTVAILRSRGENLVLDETEAQICSIDQRTTEIRNMRLRVSGRGQCSEVERDGGHVPNAEEAAARIVAGVVSRINREDGGNDAQSACGESDDCRIRDLESMSKSTLSTIALLRMMAVADGNDEKIEPLAIPPAPAPVMPWSSAVFFRTTQSSISSRPRFMVPPPILALLAKISQRFKKSRPRFLMPPPRAPPLRSHSPRASSDR